MGWPVEHSLSPVIHQFWLKACDLSGEYAKAAVKPGDFPEFLRTLREHGFCGGNVTLPHKIEAHRLCDVLDDAAEAIGAVNTVWFDGDRLHGSNTDAWGFLANLDEAAPSWDNGAAKAALIIGAGGASRAVVWPSSSVVSKIFVLLIAARIERQFLHRLFLLPDLLGSRL